jgi:hypothetical protein
MHDTLIEHLHEEWVDEKKEITNPYDLIQKYEDLVWYARKPGVLKLSTRLNDDLSINRPKDVETFQKIFDKWTHSPDKDLADCYELVVAENPGKLTEVPFEEWAKEGEKFSGFSWPEGYHAHIVKGALEYLRKVEKNYPEETKNLAQGNTDWSHGFNSGCLATLRLLEDCIHIKRSTDLKKFKKALKNFPELDT